MNLHKSATWCFRWIAPLVLLACGAWFITAMGTRSKPNRRKPPPRTSVSVEVVRAQTHAGSLDVVTSGVAIPFREVRLSAQVGGEVVFKSPSLSPGNYVNKGDVLLKVDPQDFALEIARLEQELARSQVALDQLKIDRENAQRLLDVNRKAVTLRRANVARLEKLRRANASTRSDLDATELALLTAIEQATQHENTLRQLPTQTKVLEMTRDLVALQLKRARLDLARATVVAPFAGVVIANHVEQNGSLAAGAPIATIEDTSMIEVRCSLRTQDLAIIQTSAKSPDAVTPKNSRSGNAYQLPPVAASVEFEQSNRKWVWDGTLSRQDGLGIDQRTRTMPVRIRVPKPTINRGHEQSLSNPPSMALVRGMFVRVRLHCRAEQPLLVIPESSLRPGKTVWLMREGKLEICELRVARIADGQAFVEPNSRLTIEDDIITSPIPNARNGIEVSIRGEKKPGKEDGGKRKTSQVAHPPQGLCERFVQEFRMLAGRTERSEVPASWHNRLPGLRRCAPGSGLLTREWS